MRTLASSPTWTYDDILIEPSPLSDVSHKDVDLTTRLVKHIKLPIPLVMAPMSTIRNDDLMMRMQSFGIQPWFDRSMSPETQAHCVAQLVEQQPLQTQHIAIAVSTKEEDYTKRIELCGEAAIGRNFIVKIDVANGSSQRSIQTISNIKKKYEPWVFVFSGNVCTRLGARMAATAGADGIMVGIGGGSSCKTRTETGVGKGNAHAVQEVAEAIKPDYPGVTIMADGGFKRPGDIVKALMLGADCCMSGRMFYVGHQYYGMASRRAHEERGKNDRKSFEGAELEINPRSISNVVEDVEATIGSIKSAMSYMGRKTIAELHEEPPSYNFITRAVYDESLAG